MARRIVTTSAPVPTPGPACKDCGAPLSALDIRLYCREANMGPSYRGFPRCCPSCTAL